MGTHVIIDAGTRKASASLEAPDAGTTIFVVDLIGDTWDDFSYFIVQARFSQRGDDITKRNRYVRAATAALFSHLDGLVSDVFSVLLHDALLAAYRPKNPNFCSLKTKAEAVHGFLVNHRGLSHTPPPLDLKPLRDILNHPTVTKKISEGGFRETALLDGADVYGIAVEDLDTLGQRIDQWLNAVCITIGYDRFPDTKQLAEDFAQAIGSEPTSARRF